MSIIGLVVEYIVAIDVTRVRFPDDAFVSKSKKNARHHLGLVIFFGSCLRKGSFKNKYMLGSAQVHAK